MASRLFLILACGVLAVSGAAVSRGPRDDGRQVLSYGTDPLQAIDYWAAPSPDAPLVVFVHGGGWSRGDKRMMAGSDKLEHWNARGYAVASVNYRLVPEATVEQQAADIAAALAHLKTRSGPLGFDPERIALVGHSAGAHLVALVGTDPAYLQGVGLSLDAIDGVVPLDGAAYDVAAQVSDGPPVMHRTYRQAFGTDAARQARLSPTRHADAPNAARFLILHVERDDGQRQSEALAAALRAAGTPVEVEGLPGTGLRGHARINRELGDPDYPATAMIDRFLGEIFG